MHVVDQIIGLLCEATFAVAELPRERALVDVARRRDEVTVLSRQLESTFDYPVLHGPLDARTTVRSLADDVGRHGSMPGSVVVLRPPGPGGVTFYCLGGVEQYRPLAEALPAPHGLSALFVAPEIDAVLAEAKGGTSTVESLAAHYEGGLRALAPGGPFVLGGFSFAGVVAYETARRLRAERAPVSLVVLDALLPRGYHRAARAWWGSRVREAVLDPRALVRRVRARQERVHAAEAGSTSPRSLYGAHFDKDALGEARGGICARALSAYDAEDHRFAGDLLFIQSTQEPLAPGVVVDPTFGMAALVDGEVKRVEVASTHLDLVRAPAVTEVAAAIGVWLDHPSRGGCLPG